MFTGDQPFFSAYTRGSGPSRAARPHHVDLGHRKKESIALNARVTQATHLARSLVLAIADRSLG